MMIRRLLRTISTRQLHVISRSKTNIKPSTPTPSNFKQYYLPLHDRISPDAYIPMVLFYPSHSSDHSPQDEIAETPISNRLKYSLSETLTKYYPYAGRLRTGFHVDCSDEGVDFLEARIRCRLSEVLDKPPEKGEGGLGHLFPPGLVWGKLPDKDSSLMVVQLNHFDCGGIAIAVSMSHIIGDGCTLFSFLKYWAALSRQSGDHHELVQVRPPHFIYKLPQSCDDGSIMARDITCPEKYWITKEFVFHNSKIAKLKAAVAIHDQNQGVDNENPTRLDVLAALLYRCAVAATTRSNSGSFTTSVLFHVVNMRPVMVPPLPETTVGNFININCIPTRIESETELSSLSCQIKKGKMQFRGMKTLDGNEYLPMALEYTKNNCTSYLFSSMCNFPLYDQMDFGWGKPIKVTIVDTPLVNCFIMMDTPSGDGIKAIVGLEEQHMEMFQCDKELLTYASL